MARRTNGEETIYKDKRGYWVGQYRVDGKRKTVSGRTQAEVRGKLRELRNTAEKDESIEPVGDTNLTVGEWAERWLEIYARPSVKITTYESYEAYVRNQVKPHIGNIPLARLSADALQRFFNMLAESGSASGEPLSVKTLYSIRNFLHYMIGQAVDNHMIRYNFVEAIRLPKRGHVEMRVLSRREQEQLIEAVNQSETHAALGIKFALFTGVRIGELLGLKWSSVDLENDQFRVREILRRVTDFQNEGESHTIVKSLQTTKTDSSNRTVPIIPELKADMIRYKQWQDRMAEQNPAFNPRGFVFATEEGSYIEPRTYQDLFKRTLKQARIEDANFHSLRHTFATRAIEQGMDVLVLSKILGHAQPSTTLNLYGHALPDHKQESMKKLRALYEARNPAASNARHSRKQQLGNRER